MPSKTEKQRRLFAIALGMKRGKIPYSYSPEAAKIAKSLTEKQIRDFAKKITKKRKKNG